ncbi:hypothetical protein O3M35_003741 [Rhynocoris fuscipes]|uniref:Uncharacterized protein n=1 Tax=Rhynocoris fuscipes TaxID=488301 RepID=A0AAW1CHI3_9HEMI
METDVSTSLQTGSPTSPQSSLSSNQHRPRAVYSIDQILGHNNQEASFETPQSVVRVRKGGRIVPSEK